MGGSDMWSNTLPLDYGGALETRGKQPTNTRRTLIGFELLTSRSAVLLLPVV